MKKPWVCAVAIALFVYACSGLQTLLAGMTIALFVYAGFGPVKMEEKS